jgi:hypothetical protein
MDMRKRLGIAIGMAWLLAAAPASAQSDCCEANGTPGCDDMTCQDLICGADSFCCDVSWDGTCAAAALASCDIFCPTLDDFLCHKVKRNKEGPKFEKVRDVELADQFQERFYQLKKPVAICNPATVGGDAPLLPEEHLLSFKIGREPGQEKDVKLKDVRITDRFGVIYVDTVKPDRALGVTSKGLGGPAPPLIEPVTDDFICWKVRPTKGREKFPKGVQVTVVDQFDQEALYDVKKPTRLCAPSLKPSTMNPDDHLMCYKVKRAKGEAKYEKVQRIFVAVNSVSLIFDSKKEEELCVEAAKTLPPG